MKQFFAAALAACLGLAVVLALFAVPARPDEQAWRHEGLALAMLRDIAAETDQKLDQLSEAITRAYFSHVPAAQAVGSSVA